MSYIKTRTLNKGQHKILLAIGSNENAQQNVAKMTSILKAFWSRTAQTEPYESTAVDYEGEASTAPLYTNILVEAETSMTLQEVSKLCKVAERLCGDTRDLRKKGIVKADLDILAYDKEKHHTKDWDRPYIKVLLKRSFYAAITLLSLTFIPVQDTYSATATRTYYNIKAQDSDKDLLGKAIEYFAGQKYHEALLCFLQLEKTHKLNARMLAYKGLCLFKEKEYEDAAIAFEASVPQLVQYSPHEQAVYYYSWGECYFQTYYYTAAVRALKKALEVCEPEDKAEILYRLGFSEMLLGNKEDAAEWLQQALDSYPVAIMDQSTIAHREQAKRMLRALLVTH